MTSSYRRRTACPEMDNAARPRGATSKRASSERDRPTRSLACRIPADAGHPFGRRPQLHKGGAARRRESDAPVQRAVATVEAGAAMSSDSPDCRILELREHARWPGLPTDLEHSRATGRRPKRPRGRRDRSRRGAVGTAEPGRLGPEPCFGHPTSMSPGAATISECAGSAPQRSAPVSRPARQPRAPCSPRIAGMPVNTPERSS